MYKPFLLLLTPVLALAACNDGPPTVATDNNVATERTTPCGDGYHPNPDTGECEANLPN